MRGEKVRIGFFLCAKGLEHAKRQQEFLIIHTLRALLEQRKCDTNLSRLSKFQKSVLCLSPDNIGLPRGSSCYIGTLPLRYEVAIKACRISRFEKSSPCYLGGGKGKGMSKYKKHFGNHFKNCSKKLKLFYFSVLAKETEKNEKKHKLQNRDYKISKGFNFRNFFLKISCVIQKIFVPLQWI